MKNLSILILCLILCSCSSQSETSFAAKDMQQNEERVQATEAESGMGNTDKLTERQTSSETKKVDNKKIIRTARLDVEVVDYKASRAKLDAILGEYKAMIQQEQERNLSYRLENTLAIRVAPENFEGLLRSVETLALNIHNKTVSAKDVTREFIDMETRLQSKRAVIERYQSLLKQAKNVEEILKVESQLRQVIEEVESVEGQLKYLKDQTGQSTVHLVMYERMERPAYQKPSFFSRLARSIGDGWTGFLEFLIGVATLWPLWMVLLIAIPLFRRYRRKNKNHPTP